MTSSEPLTTDIFMRRETWADPYTAYRQFREYSPVRCVMPSPDGSPGSLPGTSWCLLRHHEVFAALRDHETFSSLSSMRGSSAPKMVLIQDDPPRHQRLRRLVNKAFTLKRIAELEPWIASVALQLIDQCDGHVDLMSSYAIPFPMRVIARLLGISDEDHFKFKEWSNALLTVAATDVESANRTRRIFEMMEYFGRMAVARRDTRADDLIAALVDAEIDGERLEDWEIIGFAIVLLVAGNETTTNLIGNMLHLLVERPELWQRLRDDRLLVDKIIAETLRFESPVQFLPRVTKRDVEVSGVMIPAGQQVLLGYGAANRDPTAFTDPEAFQPDRDDVNHVAFGAGIHYCLGAPLALTEARVTLLAFVEKFTSIKRVLPALRQQANFITYGFCELPLACDPNERLMDRGPDRIAP
jgi:cytochrome P450